MGAIGTIALHLFRSAVVKRIVGGDSVPTEAFSDTGKRLARSGTRQEFRGARSKETLESLGDFRYGGGAVGTESTDPHGAIKHPGR